MLCRTLGILAALGIAGCAGNPTRPEEVEQVQVERQVGTFHRELERCLSALNDLDVALRTTVNAHSAIVRSPRGDLQSHFQSFQRGLKDVEKSRHSARRHYDVVSAAAARILSDSSVSSASYSNGRANPLGALASQFEDLWNDSGDSRNSYGELISILEDHEAYWASSLSVSTAKELKSFSKKIERLSRELRGHLSEAVAAAEELQRVIDERSQDGATVAEARVR